MILGSRVSLFVCVRVCVLSQGAKRTGVLSGKEEHRASGRFEKDSGQAAPESRGLWPAVPLSAGI